MNKVNYLYTIMGMVFLSATGCKKEWLDAKPSLSLVVPTSANDYQALLDNTNMNIQDPQIGAVSADEFEVTYAEWRSVYNPQEKNAYIWAKEMWEGSTAFDYETPYGKIFTTNVVLEGVKKIDNNTIDASVVKNIKGSALFYRAYSFFQLAQLFAKQYDPLTAAKDPGIALRENADFDIVSVRSTVQETYDKIIGDLSACTGLLPERPSIATRPSKGAVYALLARIYMSMNKYEEALKNAELALNINSTLLDFNAMDTTSALPFKLFHPEIIYFATQSSYSILNNSKVEPALYASYGPGDLRRQLYFRKELDYITFKQGLYNGTQYAFSGLATDELYLIKAECLARKGSFSEAMSTLNVLLEKRYLAGAFVPLVATDAIDALTKVLAERKKELLMRNIRWMDLRRLNKDPERAITLTRILNGLTYTLPPNDLRYVFPLPEAEIRLANMVQNPR